MALHRIATGGAAEPGAPPVPLATDFSGTASGSLTGFTPKWGVNGAGWGVVEDAAAPSGKTLRHLATDPARRALAWDAAGEHSDGMVVCRVRPSAVSGTLMRLIMRGDGAAGAESGVLCGLNGSDFNVSYYAAGDSFQGAVGFSFSAIPNQAYWLKLLAVGDFAAGKIWADGQGEPAAWGSTLRLPVLPSGFAGVGVFHPEDVRYDSLSFKAF